MTRPLGRGFAITREIGIDMGHRVPTHGSKCWNLHGHRYRILATAVSVDLHRTGVQQDMVLDFGFLKEVMMDVIDLPHDHGMTLWVDDPWIGTFGAGMSVLSEARKKGYSFIPSNRESGQSKTMVVDFIPTAERLAQFWYNRMVPLVHERSGEKANLFQVEVFETPNCSAVYPLDGV